MCFLTLTRPFISINWWGEGGGGYFSWPLITGTPLLLHWTGSLNISLLLRFLMGARNVVAGSPGCRHQFWDLSGPWLRDWWTCYCPMASLGRLFATSFNYHLSPFPSHRTHRSREGCFLQNWDELCPPYVFSDLAGSSQSQVLQADVTLLTPLDLLSLSVASPVVLPYRIDLPWQPHFHLLHALSSCLESL